MAKQRNLALDIHFCTEGCKYWPTNYDSCNIFSNIINIKLQYLPTFICFFLSNCKKFGSKKEYTSSKSLLFNSRSLNSSLVLSHKHGLLSTNSIRVTMSYLLDILLYYTTPVFSRDATKQRQTTWKTSAHLLCAPVRRICRGSRRHHADMSGVVPITLSCRPRVLPGHKDYMKYQYHRYRHRHRHRFCRCVYARPKL